LPVVIVVLADASYGLIKHYQSAGGRMDNAKVDFLPVDFAGLARANGCLGWKARSIEEFQKMLRRALESRQPALIEFPISYRYRF